MPRSTASGSSRRAAASAALICTLAMSCVALVDLDELSSNDAAPSPAGSPAPDGSAARDATDEAGNPGSGGGSRDGAGSSGAGGGGRVAGAGGGEDLQACELPWGGAITHDQSVTAYESPSVAWGAVCQSETRICIDGALSGSFSYQDCTPAGLSYALVDSGRTIADCLDIGGEPVEIDPDEYVCRRSGMSCTDASCSCWAGWSQYENWSTTKATTCSGSCCGGTYSPTTQEHPWGDIARESSSYYNGPSNCGLPPDISDCNEHKCYAKVTELGCN